MDCLSIDKPSFKSERVKEYSILLAPNIITPQDDVTKALYLIDSCSEPTGSF